MAESLAAKLVNMIHEIPDRYALCFLDGNKSKFLLGDVFQASKYGYCVYIGRHVSFKLMSQGFPVPNNDTPYRLHFAPYTFIISLSLAGHVNFDD